jgi:predicted CopG family antitoxin
MQKKLTITVDERVYDGLYSVVGRQNISQFIESLVRPHVVKPSLESAYQEMALDEARENEALEWADATIGDIKHETW